MVNLSLDHTVPLLSLLAKLVETFKKENFRVFFSCRRLNSQKAINITCSDRHLPKPTLVRTFVTECLSLFMKNDKYNNTKNRLVPVVRSSWEKKKKESKHLLGKPFYLRFENDNFVPQVKEFTLANPYKQNNCKSFHTFSLFFCAPQQKIKRFITNNVSKFFFFLLFLLSHKNTYKNKVAHKKYLRLTTVRFEVLECWT